MPSHAHVVTAITSDGNANPIVQTKATGTISGAVTPEKFGWTNTGETWVNTFKEGQGKAHNNMPPYLTVNIWKRVK